MINNFNILLTKFILAKKNSDKLPDSRFKSDIFQKDFLSSLGFVFTSEHNKKFQKPFNDFSNLIFKTKDLTKLNNEDQKELIKKYENLKQKYNYIPKENFKLENYNVEISDDKKISIFTNKEGYIEQKYLTEKGEVTKRFSQFSFEDINIREFNNKQEWFFCLNEFNKTKKYLNFSVWSEFLRYINDNGLTNKARNDSSYLTKIMHDLRHNNIIQLVNAPSYTGLYDDDGQIKFTYNLFSCAMLDEGVPTKVKLLDVTKEQLKEGMKALNDFTKLYPNSQKALLCCGWILQSPLDHIRRAKLNLKSQMLVLTGYADTGKSSMLRLPYLAFHFLPESLFYQNANSNSNQAKMARRLDALSYLSILDEFPQQYLDDNVFMNMLKSSVSPGSITTHTNSNQNSKGFKDVYKAIGSTAIISNDDLYSNDSGLNQRIVKIPFTEKDVLFKSYNSSKRTETERHKKEKEFQENYNKLKPKLKYVWHYVHNLFIKNYNFALDIARSRPIKASEDILIHLFNEVKINLPEMNFNDLQIQNEVLNPKDFFIKSLMETVTTNLKKRGYIFEFSKAKDFQNKPFEDFIVKQYNRQTLTNERVPFKDLLRTSIFPLGFVYVEGREFVYVTQSIKHFLRENNVPQIPSLVQLKDWFNVKNNNIKLQTARIDGKPTKVIKLPIEDLRKLLAGNKITEEFNEDPLNTLTPPKQIKKENKILSGEEVMRQLDELVKTPSLELQIKHYLKDKNDCQEFDICTDITGSMEAYEDVRKALRKLQEKDYVKNIRVGVWREIKQ